MKFAQIIEQVTTSAETQANFLTDGQCTYTYAALPSTLNTIGSYFQEKNIGREDCLAIECPNSVPGALTLLYLLQEGVSFVLLPPNEKELNLKPTPQFCRYRVVIKRAGRKASEEWAQDPDNFLAIEKNAGYQHQANRADQGKLYLRTSGSMGVSKIVVHSHDKLLGNAFNCVTNYQIEPTDRVVIPVPLAHMYGFGAIFLAAIMTGASIDLLDNCNILKYLGRERQFCPNIAFVTPSLCEMLLRAFQTPRHYKVVVTSGQRIKEELFRAFDERVGGCLINQYGSSEMGAIAACQVGDTLEERVTTIGLPMSGVKLRVAQETDEQIGALFCKHEHGFEGYVDEKGTWIHRHQSDEWYQTGDLAHKKPNGSIQIVGRAKNSINRSGYLVLFSDIEKMMEKIDGVEQVVVVSSKEQGKRGEQMVAFCVLSHEATLSRVQIRKACFDRLPAVAIPEEVFILKSWPMLASGKVDQQALVEMATGPVQ